MVSDFMAAINQIAAERGIDAEEVFQALESAILVAYKREYLKDESHKDYDLEEGEDKPEENFSVEFARDTGTFRVLARKEVVKETEDDSREIALDEAQMISPDLELGDTVEIEMPTEDFGRIAAQTAKQVILQKVRESEKEAVLSEYSDKVGEVFTALMQRMQRGQAVFEIGKATAFMPVEEQIPSEFYRVGERYKVLLKSLEDTARGKELVVSRAAPEFLVELFRMEVPEIESEVVEIKAVAREAGSRSKIAVQSHQDGVDPIGSCVGQRGIRIANVMSELGEEKIDIIEWHEDIEEFVANSLSPAKVISVDVVEEEDDFKVATVKVDEDQLSLAIGRDGQNVRLAWKLSNVKIDIVGPDGEPTRGPDSEKSDEEGEGDEKESKSKKSKSKGDKEKSEGLSDALTKKLEKAGKKPEDVADWSVKQLVELEGIGKVTAEKINEALS